MRVMHGTGGVNRTQHNVMRRTVMTCQDDDDVSGQQGSGQTELTLVIQMHFALLFCDGVHPDLTCTNRGEHNFSRRQGMSGWVECKRV